MEQEEIVMQKIIETWNEFLKLNVLHPDDTNEFRFHIHAIQNIVIAREYLKNGGFKVRNNINTNKRPFANTSTRRR